LIAMRLATPLLAVALIAALAGCEGAQPAAPQTDIDFVRGCWVSHDQPGGSVTALLRLLPDREDGTTLTGYLSVMHDDPTMSSLKSNTELTLTRDGSTFTITPSGEPAQTLQRSDPPYTAVEALAPGEPVAAFTASPETQGWTVITGGEDRLTIYTVLPDYADGETLFNGERDGCD
jgi:hypothetical protein